MKKIIFILMALVTIQHSYGQNTDAQNTTQFNVIRNETVPGANTRGRIADAYEALNHSKVSRMEALITTGTNDYVIAADPAIVSYSNGGKTLQLLIRFVNANTGAVQVNVNSIGLVALTKGDGTALVSGDIKAGQMLWIAYTGTVFQIVGGIGTSTGTLLAVNNLSDLVSAPTALTNLGGTTIGKNLFTLTNPSAITFPRFNADNTVTARTAAQLIGDLGTLPYIPLGGSATLTADVTVDGAAAAKTINLGDGFTINPLNRFNVNATNGVHFKKGSNEIIGFDGSGSIFLTPTGTATGDMYFHSVAGNFERIPIGANTYIMTSDGTNPSWQPAAGGSSPFSDAIAILKDNVDATKLLRMELGGFTTGVTRVLTPPNFDGIIATTNNPQTITGVQTFSSLPTIPVTPVVSTDAASKGYVDGLTISTPVAATLGGTGFASYAVGDILRATTTTALSKLALGSALQGLRVNAGGTDIEWAAIGGGGTPGGSTTQLQYNNAGVFGGMSAATYNSGTGVTTFTTAPVVPTGTPLSSDTKSANQKYVDDAILAAGLTIPITIPNGGTGNTSFIAYSLLAGGTTSTGALQQISNAGAVAGYNLTWVSSSALPTWQAAAVSGWSLSGASTITGNTSQSGAFTNTFLMDGVLITQNALSAGWKPALKITPGAGTGMTTGTEFNTGIYMPAFTNTWTGTTGLSLQRFNYFAAPTAANASAMNISDEYNGYFDAPAVSGSMTATNKWALGSNGNFKVIGNSTITGTLSTNGGGSVLDATGLYTNNIRPGNGATTFTMSGSQAANPAWTFGAGASFTQTTGTIVYMGIIMPVAAASGSANFAMIGISGGQSTAGTGYYAGMLVNPTYNLVNDTYGLRYDPTIVTQSGTNYAWYSTSGSALFGNSNANTLTASTRIDVRGIGTTTGNILRLADSGNTTKLTVLDNGNITATGSLTLAQGTTTLFPLKFLGGSVLTTPQAFTQEASTYSFYQTKNQLLRYGLGGVIFENFADANNGTTVETDLYSYTTPALTMEENGEKIIARYVGTFNDVTATSQLKVYFAGTVIGNTGALTVSATGGWVADVLIIRTGTTTARAAVNISTPGASTALYTAETDLTGLTLSGTNILKVTGQAGGGTGGSNDITAKFSMGYWMPTAHN